jgi:aminotransferase
MKELSSMARNIPPSPIREMFNMASKMENVISFALGEPDFTTPKNIIDAACAGLQDGQTHYTLNAGIKPLREAISKSLRKVNKIEVDPDNEIIVTAGGMEALILCMMALISQGDEVIITNPYWPNHPAQVTMCGGVPRFVEVYEKNGFIYNPENLEKAINEKTKAILINSPANPTGGVADRDVLERIAEIAIKHDLYVISDEVYKHFVYDNAEFVSISSLDGMKERTIVIDSFSKTYAMTGWRLGYAAGPSDVIQNMIKLHENVAACNSQFTQSAGVEALEGDQESLRFMIDKYASRRDLIVNGINGIEGLSCIKPKGAFYVFMNVAKTGLSSQEFALRLLKEKGVVVVPGTGFGDAGEGFVRLSYATSEENILEGLSRIKDFMRE